MSGLRLGPLVLSSLLACDPAASGDDDPEPDRNEPIELAEPSRWLATPAELDPWVDHRPTTVVCPSAAYGLEFGVLEVDTGQCNYLSVTQTLTHPIALGDPLRVTLWWQTLIAEAPAEAHLALLVEGESLWEAHVEIPGPADLRQIEFVSPIAASPGAALTFHLHNHGYNSWTLAGLELLPEE
jgi:hypothetical protein